MNSIHNLRIRKLIVIGVLLIVLCGVVLVSNCSAATEEYTLTYRDDSSQSLKESELFQEFEEHSN